MNTGWVHTAVSLTQRDAHARAGDRSAHGKHGPVLGLTLLSRSAAASSGSSHTSAMLFLHTLREEQLQTLTEEIWWGWSYINTPCFGSFCCHVLSRDQHLQNEWTPQCPVTAQESSSQSAMPSSFMGPRWTFPPWERLHHPLPMPSPSQPSSHPVCWSWKIHQPLSVCPGSQCAHSSLLLSALFLQFSSVWISLLPFFPVPHYIHIHPH